MLSTTWNFPQQQSKGGKKSSEFPTRKKKEERRKEGSDNDDDAYAAAMHIAKTNSASHPATNVMHEKTNPMISD